MTSHDTDSCWYLVIADFQDWIVFESEYIEFTLRKKMTSASLNINSNLKSFNLYIAFVYSLLILYLKHLSLPRKLFT